MSANSVTKEQVKAFASCTRPAAAGRPADPGRMVAVRLLLPGLAGAVAAVMQRHAEGRISMPRDGTYWLATTPSNKNICLRLNHQAGRGCGRAGACQYRHVCVLCGGADHGAYQPACPLRQQWAAGVAQLAKAFGVSPNDLDGIAERLRSVQAQQIVRLNGANELEFKTSHPVFK